MQKLLCEMQVDFICASKNTSTNATSDLITRNHSSAQYSLAKGVLRMRTARGIICRFSW